MSQSERAKKRRSSTSGGSGSSKNAARRTPATPPVQRTAPQQTARDRVDRVLPPFTTQRYVAIWILGMIPLVLVLMLLLRPGDNTSNTTNPEGQDAQPTLAAGAVTEPTPAAGRTELPVVSDPTGTTATGVSGSTGTVAPAGGEKYMIIETDKGRIVAQLYTDPSANVPNTISNFERKANAGEFNGRVFHRVEDWVIQGGDPTGTGSGGGTMPSEYNQLTFKAGALGIARGPDPAINNDSQFFIVKTDSPHLDTQYTNWGQVIEGLDVVNQIAIGDKMNRVTISEQVPIASQGASTPVPDATTISVLPPPTPEPQAPEVTLADIAAQKERLTDAQWDAYVESLKGMRITDWQGTVQSVDQKFLSNDFRMIVDTQDPVPGYAFDLYVDVPKEEALSINKGQSVTVSGTISKINCALTLCPIELENATYR